MIKLLVTVLPYVAVFGTLLELDRRFRGPRTDP